MLILSGVGVVIFGMLGMWLHDYQLSRLFEITSFGLTLLSLIAFEYLLHK